jgi:hypothetical protein
MNEREQSQVKEVGAFLGLAHTVPPPKQAHWFALRWREWEPYCLIAARRTTDPASELHRLKTLHHSRLMDLLAARVSWLTIRERRLDSPITSNGDFEWHLREAVERRTSRMGRVKGQSKHDRKRNGSQPRA